MTTLQYMTPSFFASLAFFGFQIYAVFAFSDLLTKFDHFAKLLFFVPSVMGLLFLWLSIDDEEPKAESKQQKVKNE